MAVIDSVNGARVRERTEGPLTALLDLDLGLPAVDRLVREVRGEVAAEVWGWFREHPDHVVLSVSVAFLTVYRVRLRQLDGLVEWIVGPEPEGAAASRGTD